MNPMPTSSSTLQDQPSRPGRRLARDGGFAVGLVLLLLFAIAVAGAAGYQAVLTEARLALQSQEGSQALAIAQAGLYRYFGEQGGAPVAADTFSIAGGEAIVTARKVQTLTYPEEMYLVTSTGTFIDPRFSVSPAQRTVRQYARRTRISFEKMAGMITTSSAVNLYNVRFHGQDQAKAGACAGAPAASRNGLGLLNTYTEYGGVNTNGSPGIQQYGTAQVLLDSINLRWDVLQDTNFPVDFEGLSEWPNFASLPADSFPTIRINGNFNAFSTYSGRGVLIVTEYIYLQTGFDWEGIILAGKLPEFVVGVDFRIQGNFITGLDGGQGTVWLWDGGHTDFHSCFSIDASNSLTYLAPLDNTWWESF